MMVKFCMQVQYPGSVHDLNIFRREFNNISEQLLVGERMLADKGYISQEFNDFLITPFKKINGYLSENQKQK
jgi:hypothetical protein